MKLFALLALAFGPLPSGDALDAGEVQRLSLADEHASALEAANALVESPAFTEADESARAAAWFTVAVARHRAEEPQLALDAFLSARDLGGPGRTRLAAMYDIGTLLLEQAERVRATIPEVSGQTGQQAHPSAPGAPGAPDAEEAPDPLETARAGYLGARAALLDRLRTEIADADTRANLELVVRRLRELDEIERQREEQEQEQEEQQDQEQSEDSEDESQSEESEDSEDQQEQPQDGEDQESEEEPSPEEEQPPPEEEPGEGESEEQPAPEEQEQEQELMSPEEIQRLMDRLREIEEQARAVQAMLRRKEQVPVEKDW